MSERPEHVRCENCCYWIEWAEPGDEFRDNGKGMSGECRRATPVPPVTAEQARYSHCEPHWPIPRWSDWCGEFRAEWPEGIRVTPTTWRDCFTTASGPCGTGSHIGDADGTPYCCCGQMEWIDSKWVPRERNAE